MQSACLRRKNTSRLHPADPINRAKSLPMALTAGFRTCSAARDELDQGRDKFRRQSHHSRVCMLQGEGCPFFKYRGVGSGINMETKKERFVLCIVVPGIIPRRSNK